MFVTLFPLVDKKRSNRSGNNPNQIQNWPSRNGKYENTLYTCIYQKHEVPVYTVEIGLNYKQEPNLSPEPSFLSRIQAHAHTVSWYHSVASHSFFVHEHTLPWIKLRKKSFNLQSL